MQLTIRHPRLYKTFPLTTRRSPVTSTTQQPPLSTETRALITKLYHNTHEQLSNLSTRFTSQQTLLMSDLLSLIANRRQYHPINETILSHLAVSDIIRLQRSSKNLSGVYQDALRTEWSINAYLKPFFADPIRFRNVQAETEALVTGPAALGFFERRRIFSTDEGIALKMHLIVDIGAKADALNAFLKSDGYTEADSVWHDSSSTELKVFTFAKPMKGMTEQLVEVTVEHFYGPAETFLHEMVCTNMGLVLAWNKAYCLFPIALEQKVAYLTTPICDADVAECRMNRTFVRNSSQGYTLRNASWLELLDKTSPSRLELGPLRQFSDRYSWIINLDMSGLDTHKESSINLDYATFSLTKNARNETVVPCLDIDVVVILSVVLRHKYILATPPESPTRLNTSMDDATRDAIRLRMQFKDLIGTLEEAALLQFSLLEPEDRPANYKSVAREVFGRVELENFTVPDWWSYHDAAVQAYLFRLRDHINTWGVGKSDK
jgi:hypothetical protein